MSPEQAEVAPLDVDIRSDVYSLGVILCELLLGELPYATRLADAARARSTSPRGLVARALEPQQRIVPQMRRTYGADHPYTLNAAGNLACDKRRTGQREEALRDLEAVIELQRRQLGLEH